MDTDKVFVKHSFPHQKKNILPAFVAKDITKSLYEKEYSMNGFEELAINDTGNMRTLPFGHETLKEEGLESTGL